MTRRMVQVLVFIVGALCGRAYEAYLRTPQEHMLRYRLRSTREGAIACYGMVADHWLTRHGDDPTSWPIILQAEELQDSYEKLLRKEEK